MSIDIQDEVKEKLSNLELDKATFEKYKGRVSLLNQGNNLTDKGLETYENRLENLCKLILMTKEYPISVQIVGFPRLNISCREELIDLLLIKELLYKEKK